MSAYGFAVEGFKVEDLGVGYLLDERLTIRIL